MNNVMYSSKSDEWATPQYLFDELNAIYKFTLDPAATKENAKCEKYYTANDDGLNQSWANEVVFCNPPYGRSIGHWVRKGYEESIHSIVVMLLPSRTDTIWFHEYCLKGRIKFLKGRLRFGGSKENAPFPSMLVMFDRR